MRFHGTLLFTYSPSLPQQPNAQQPLVQALSSPRSQTYVQVTCLNCAPRACVSSKKSFIVSRACWTKENLYSCWSLTCNHGVRCRDELMWEQQQSTKAAAVVAATVVVYAEREILCAQCPVCTTRTAVVVLVMPITKNWYQVFIVGTRIGLGHLTKVRKDEVERWKVISGTKRLRRTA